MICMEQTGVTYYISGCLRTNYSFPFHRYPHAACRIDEQTSQIKSLMPAAAFRLQTSPSSPTRVLFPRHEGEYTQLARHSPLPVEVPAGHCRSRVQDIPGCTKQRAALFGWLHVCPDHFLDSLFKNYFLFHFTHKMVHFYSRT
jgi:hypothetical protein